MSLLTTIAGRGNWALLIALLLAIPTLAALADEEDSPVGIPPIIPRDSIFAPAERRPELVAMTQPASATTNYVPYPEQIRPIDTIPRVYLDDRGRVVTKPVPPDLRPRIFQGFTYRSTWISGGDPGTLGISSMGLETTLASPWLVGGAPPLVTPFFTLHSLQGPLTPDMPSRLYDTGVELRWIKQVRPRLGVDLAVAPAVFSDFNNSLSSAFRVVGRGVVLWDLTPRWQVALGGVYLGRLDIPALPVAGLIWEPNEEIRIEAVFPRPRAAWRFIPPEFIDRLACSRIGPLVGFTPDQDHWAYVVGNLGGNTYAIRRESGLEDRVTYSDLRVALGWERRIERGITSRSEIGYAFSRSLNYESAPGRIYMRDGIMMNSEVNY